MSIAVITLEGESKIEFVNSLHAKTNGAVSLVIVQKRPPMPLLKRISTFFRNNKKPLAILSVVLLYLNLPVRRKLDYFRHRTRKSDGKGGWLPPTMVVSSVNDEAVRERLSEISPSLIVVWGSGILKKHIVKTGKTVINLHFGLAPHYRGAVANQFAVLRDDIGKVGATIHHVSHEADAGDIIETVLPDAKKPPLEMFRDLNDRAEERFLDIAVRLHRGEKLPRIKQDHSIGDIFLLKQWTPEMRYKVGRKILLWEKEGRPRTV